MKPNNKQTNKQTKRTLFTIIYSTTVVNLVLFVTLCVVYMRDCVSTCVCVLYTSRLVVCVVSKLQQYGYTLQDIGNNLKLQFWFEKLLYDILKQYETRGRKFICYYEFGSVTVPKKGNPPSNSKKQKKQHFIVFFVKSVILVFYDKKTQF